MRHLIRLRDYTKEDVFEIFRIADGLTAGKYSGALQRKAVVSFFPESSIRTRLSFEKGIILLGGHTVLFPPEALDKKESLRDVTGYLNNWADAAVIRHKSIFVLDEISRYADFPVINAMTSENHPCEILSDLYALSKIRRDFTADRYLFCGAKGNIGLAWKEAAQVLGLSLSQCCPKGYEIEGVPVGQNLREAIRNQDIVCTDSWPSAALAAFEGFQVSREIMGMANDGAILNPCPPFFRGEEVSDDAIESAYFAGYGFKQHLLEVQQAILIFNMMH